MSVTQSPTAHSPTLLNRRMRRVDSFGSILDEDALSLRLEVASIANGNGALSKEAVQDRDKEDSPSTPSSPCSPPSSSGLHTPDSSLDLGSPVGLRFIDKPLSTADVAEEDSEELLRADFRIRRMRARKLERFFGVPAPKIQKQVPSLSSPNFNMNVNAREMKSSMESARGPPTPVPRPTKQPSKSSIAPTTTSSDGFSQNGSTTDLLQRARSHSSADSHSRRPSLHSTTNQPVQYTTNSHSISTSTPTGQAKQSRHAHSQSHVDIGVERGKRWPPLTSMVKDIERDRAKPILELVDESNAEQMRDVMLRLRKLK